MARNSRKRRLLPKRERQEILSQFGNQCAVCGQLLNVKEIHHILFFSLGGDEREGNLIPLCPTCHSLFPHKLAHVASVEAMRDLREQRCAMSKAESQIIGSLDRNPLEAALTLIDPQIRRRVLNSGRYEGYLQLALAVDKELPGADPTASTLRDKVRLFAAELSLYLDREDIFLDSALSSTQRLAQSSELFPWARSGWLTVSRLVGRKGDPISEERFLERAYPSESDDTNGETLNWSFRALAFYKKMRRFEDFGMLLAEVGDINEISDFATRANIQSEIGRVHLLTDCPALAYDHFSTTLNASLRRFHLRGVFLSALFMTRAALASGHTDDAANALLMASQFLHLVSRQNERRDYERLRLKLARTLGPDALNALWAMA